MLRQLKPLQNIKQQNLEASLAQEKLRASNQRYLSQLNTEFAQRGRIGRVIQQGSAAMNFASQSALSYFGMMAGPASLVALATRELSLYNSELERVGQNLIGGRAGLGQNAQLAVIGGGKAEMNTAMAEIKEIFGTGATTTLGEAGDFRFKLKQADFDASQRSIFARAVASGVLPEAATTATSIAALRKAFPTLSPSQATGMGIFAGSVSPGATDRLIQDAAKGAAQMEQLGWKPAEVLAATSFLTAAFPAQGAAADRMDAFGRQFERFGLKAYPELAGKGMMEVVDFVSGKKADARKRGLSTRDVEETFFGNRSEAIAAFRTFAKNRAGVGELIAGTATADGGLVDRAIALAEGTPEIASARAAQASANQLELSRMDAAMTNQLFQSLLNQSLEGQNAFGTMLTRFSGFRMGLTEGSQEFTLRNAAADPAMAGTQLQQDILTHLQNIDGKTKSAPLRGGRQE